MSTSGSLTEEEKVQYQKDFTDGWDLMVNLDIQARQVAGGRSSLDPRVNYDEVYNELLCMGIRKSAPVIKKMGEAYRALKLDRFYENFTYGDI